MIHQNNTPAVSCDASTRVTLKPTHKPSVASEIVKAVVAALSKEERFLRTFSEIAINGVLPVQISTTGKKGAQCEVSLSGNRISVVIPQRLTKHTSVCLAVEEQFLTLAMKEELLSLGTTFVLDGTLSKESTAVVEAMADRYQEMKGRGSCERRRVWQEVVDIRSSELQSLLKKLGKKPLVFSPLGDDKGTHEQVTKMLRGLAQERVVALLGGGFVDQEKKLSALLDAINEQFATALWREQYAQASDCRGAVHFLELGLQRGGFTKALPLAIRPEVKHEPVKGLLQESIGLSHSLYPESNLQLSSMGLAGMGIGKQLKATTKAFSEILQFEAAVRDNCLSREDALADTMEGLLETTDRFAKALLSKDPEDSQVVADVMAQLLALRFSGQKTGEAYFTFTLSGLSPGEFDRGQLYNRGEFAGLYVQFLSLAAALRAGQVSPASAMADQQGFMPGIAIRAFRVLIHAYESALAGMLDASNGISCEKMDFLNNDIDSLERAVAEILPFLKSQEMKIACETMVRHAIEGVRNAVRQLHLFTLSGKELVNEVRGDTEFSSNSLLTERLVQSKQALQVRINEYAQLLGSSVGEDIAKILDGDSIVPLVDYVVNLLKVVRIDPDAERDEKLFDVINQALHEMVNLIREGYGSEIDLIGKLDDRSAVERHTECILRGLEALSSMHRELLYVRTHLRSIDDRIESSIFNRIEIFLDQVPKHFGLSLKRHAEELERVIGILANAGKASPLLSDNQRNACIEGLGLLRGYKSVLSREAHVQLNQLLSVPR